jgi:serine/threonine protein kinase
VEQWRGTPLLAMEYLPNGTLAAQLRRGLLSEAATVALVRQVARSLARVHARGLYHGDIKPSNIGIGPGGTAKLLDFGLARALSAHALSAPDAEGGAAARPPLGGTWAYLPLEVRDGAAPGPGLDLWALGLVFCEALLGTHPFPHARTRYDVTAGLLAARARLRARSPAHERVVASMLAIEPRDRPGSAEAFEHLLADLA